MKNVSITNHWQFLREFGLGSMIFTLAPGKQLVTASITEGRNNKDNKLSFYA